MSRTCLKAACASHGNRIRVTAKLVEAATDTQLWSEWYDSELDDIFAIQDGYRGERSRSTQAQIGHRTER